MGDNFPANIYRVKRDLQGYDSLVKDRQVADCERREPPNISLITYFSHFLSVFSFSFLIFLCMNIFTESVGMIQS